MLICDTFVFTDASITLSMVIDGTSTITRSVDALSLNCFLNSTFGKSSTDKTSLVMTLWILISIPSVEVSLPSISTFGNSYTDTASLITTLGLSTLIASMLVPLSMFWIFVAPSSHSSTSSFPSVKFYYDFSNEKFHRLWMIVFYWYFQNLFCEYFLYCYFVVATLLSIIEICEFLYLASLIPFECAQFLLLWW